MSNRKANIQALIVRCEADLAKVAKEYRNSLDAQKIGNDLKVDIKNLCENLRSVLDYIAHDLGEKYCPDADPKTQFYFLIRLSKPDFEGSMERSYPGLHERAPDLWAYLESVQPYYNAFRWLDSFNRVNNENKHGNLVEQTRTETDQVKVSFQGGNVRWLPKNVKFGSGVSIGGIAVDPRTQMPVPHPSQKVERIRWVDFRFADLNVSALGLLREAFAGIKGIAIGTEKWL
jgi:hypothetical protein